MEDSAPMPLQRRSADHRGLHRFFRFDPTLSTGSLLQLGALLLGFATAYGTYVSDRTETKAAVESIRETAKRDRADVEKVVERLGGDLREIKSDVKEVGLKLAEIKGQQQGKK
jgi:hypothetical protein